MPATTYNRYILNEANSARAIEQGLAEADWYTCPIPKEELRKLLQRRNGPALRDTILWFALLGASGYTGFLLWGTWWAILPFLIYGVIYGSTSDSRWHESSHGTAFKSDWLNNALYEISSFMVMRESTVWRWSHTRHHSDTIIVGRDPEIAVPLPDDNWSGPTGFIHEVLGNDFLKSHSSPEEIDYYLCGPPVMIKATREMLGNLGVPSDRISFDEF